MREIGRVPEGVTIIPSRASNFDRERVKQHIEAMTEEGRLSPLEAVTRIQHVAGAESWDDLGVLIQDLPNLPFQAGYWRDFNWNSPKYWAPVLGGGLLLSTFMIAVPGIILATMNDYNTVTGTAIWLPFLIVGIFGTVITLIWGSCKL